MDFNTELSTFPSGEEYYKLFVGKHQIGTAQIVPNGYLALGRRKAVATLKEAGKQCLDSSMNKCMKKHSELRRLLQRLLKDY